MFEHIKQWVYLLSRFSDKNQKAIDLLRTKCLKLKCMVSFEFKDLHLTDPQFSRACAMESFTRSCAETLNEPTERASSEPQSIARLVFTFKLSLSKLFIRSRSTTCLLIMRSCSSAKTSKRKTTWRWGFFHRPGSCGFSPSQVSNPLVFKNQLLENQARPLQCSSGLYSGWAISQSLHISG